MFAEVAKWGCGIVVASWLGAVHDNGGRGVSVICRGWLTGVREKQRSVVRCVGILHYYPGRPRNGCLKSERVAVKGSISAELQSTILMPEPEITELVCSSNRKPSKQLTNMSTIHGRCRKT